MIFFFFFSQHGSTCRVPVCGRSESDSAVSSGGWYNWCSLRLSASVCLVSVCMCVCLSVIVLVCLHVCLRVFLCVFCQSHPSVGCLFGAVCSMSVCSDALCCLYESLSVCLLMSAKSVSAVFLPSSIDIPVYLHTSHFYLLHFMSADYPVSSVLRGHCLYVSASACLPPRLLLMSVCCHCLLHICCIQLLAFVRVCLQLCSFVRIVSAV